MRNFLSIVAIAGLLLITQGCHSLKKRDTVDGKHTLFVNMNKMGKNFSVKNLTSDLGDVNLKTLQVSSDAVLMKLCGDKEDTRCQDKILDTVEQSVKRHAVLKSYNHLMFKNGEHKLHLETLYKRYIDTYIEDSKKIKLRYLVNDETKLYKGEKLPFEELLYVGLNELKYPKKTLHEKEIGNLFPHDMNGFQSDVNTLTRTLEDDYKKDLTIYKRTLNKRSGFYPLKRRSSMREGLFTLKVQAPKRVDRKFQGTKRIIFHVLGKDMHDIYPDSFKGENKDLKVTFTKRSTSFINLTHKNISLESITFFYNGYNQTTLLGRNFTFSELDAKETTSTPSSLFFTKRFKQAAFYPALSKAKAKAKKVNFGIEVKYKIEGKSSSQVFSSSKKEILWRFITGW